jgi:rhamnogalacturonan endolyase
MMGKISVLIALIAGSFQCTQKESSCGTASHACCVSDDGVQKEFLDRGFVAFTRADTSVYLGWRLLEDDPADVAFNLYRKMIGAVPDNDYVKVNSEPITRSTNYVDKGSDYRFLEGSTPKVHEAHRYKLTRIVDGKEEDVAGGETYVFLSLGDKNYRSILLNDINSTASKLGIGDLDGDGAYDFVVLLSPLRHVDPGTCEDCWYRSRDTYKLEAYSSTGRFLWQHDLGWSIETGLWFAPFIVYDLDGDGKAEVYIKGGEGDPRELDGRVMTGPEYLFKIDGMTGKVVRKRPWISRNIERQRSYDWTSRNHMGLAFLDGKKPSLIMQRGNYGIIKIEALDKNLKTEWTFSTDDHEDCWGCGGHNIRVADIDEDGKDELLPGTFALDDDGKPLWSLRLFHNDGSAVVDIDPDRPGLEIFYCIETGVPRNGVCMVDAATGEYIMEYDRPTEHVHSGATVADFDPKYPGMECYADADRGDPTHPFLFSAKGERLSDSFRLNAKPIHWDDDEYKELLSNKGFVYKFGGDTLSRDVRSGEICDLFGDWREESIALLKGEIRIYSSTVPAGNRKVTFMQDHQYRMGAAAFSSGYATTPQPGLAKDAKHKYSH